jgi:hypothetical protein
MAFTIDHTSNGNIFLKGFPQNLNPYPNLSIENGGVLGYLNGFPIQYIAAYDNGNSYTWGNIVSAESKYWLRIGEPNPGYPPYEGSPYWKLYTIESPIFIFEPSANSYEESYLNEILEEILPINNLQEGEFLGNFIASEITNTESAEITLNYTQGNSEILISGSCISSISNLQEKLNLKENLINLGDVYDQNTGILANNIVVVEKFQNNLVTINPFLISSYAIKDTFKINNTGELITLCNSDIGDVAIDTNNNKNYILCSNENQAYLNINNWTLFNLSGFGESVIYINGHAADGLGNIDIDSNEIYYCTSAASASDKISETNVATTGVLQNYQKCNLFLNQTGNYALTNIFNNIACTKINQYHEHEITGITNLSGRLEVLKFLNSGNLVNSERSYSYFLGNQNYTYDCNSFILGQYGLSCYRSEIVYTPSSFCTIETGNLQSSIIIATGETNTDDCISLMQLNINENNFHFLVANVVGRSNDGQICAAYDLYANMARQNGSGFRVQDTVCEIKGESLNIDFNVICESLYSLDLSGYLNKSMKWFSKINVIQIQDTGYNLFIGTE